MLCKAFRFGRLSSSQLEQRTSQVNDFMNSVSVIGLPQVTACDEDGPVMFVFYTEKQAEVAAPIAKTKKD